MPTNPPDAAYQTHDVQHFERWSRDYENSWMQRRIFAPVHAAALDFAAPLPAPGSVLDIGCGTGRLLRAAARRWPEAHLIGVDAAQGMVDVARELTPGAELHRGLAEALPLPDASVDLVLSTMSFHHWHDQRAGVREIRRVLRPGGHFILVDAAPPRFWKLLPIFRTHALPTAARQRLLATVGLRIERQETVVYRFIVATLAARWV